MPINIISTLKPKNSGSFPIAEDIDGYGGYQVRDDVTDRNLIPSLNRIEGMLVYVKSEDKYYTLSGGITNSDWIEVILGGGSSRNIVLITSPTIHNVPSGENQLIINNYDPGELIPWIGPIITIALPSSPTELQEVIVKTFQISGISDSHIIDVNGGSNYIDGNVSFSWAIKYNYCLKIRWTGLRWSIISYDPYAES